MKTAVLAPVECELLIVMTRCEALRTVDAESVNLIGMDCQMPEMDGVEANRLGPDL